MKRDAGSARSRLVKKTIHRFIGVLGLWGIVADGHTFDLLVANFDLDWDGVFDYQGQTVRYFLRLGERQLQAINMIDDRPFEQGAEVRIGFRAKDASALPTEAQ